LLRGNFLTRKRELAIIVEAPITSLRIALMRRKRARMTREREVIRNIKEHITREGTMVEKLTLVMNGIPVMKALVKKKGRRLQP
jgi:hypothetical protein